MKVQIKQFNSHQTAKVFAVLIAISSFLLMIPFSLMFSMMPGPEHLDGTHMTMSPFSVMIFVMPIFQGIFGYLFIRLGTWMYNKLVPKIGGIEFELEDISSN